MVHLEHKGIYDRKDIKSEMVVPQRSDKPLEQASILNIIQRGITLLISGASGMTATQYAQKSATAKMEIKRFVSRGNIDTAMDKMLYHAEKGQNQGVLNQLFTLLGRWNRLTQAHNKGTVSSSEFHSQRNSISICLLELAEDLFD
jgi:Effector-associated domain 11